MPELQAIAQPTRGIRVVEEFFEALCASDLDRALTFLSDDVVYQNVPFPPDRGKAATERTLRMFMPVVREFDVKMHNIAERDGVVLTERTDIMRSRFLDAAFWVCGTFEVENGKITLWRDRFDLGNLLFELATGKLRRLF